MGTDYDFSNYHLALDVQIRLHLPKGPRLCLRARRQDPLKCIFGQRAQEACSSCRGAWGRFISEIASIVRHSKLSTQSYRLFANHVNTFYNNENTYRIAGCLTRQSPRFPPGSGHVTGSIGLCGPRVSTTPEWMPRSRRVQEFMPSCNKKFAAQCL